MEHAGPPPPDAKEKRTRRALGVVLGALDGALAGEPLADALAQALGRAKDAGPRERKAAVRAARGVVRDLRRVDALLQPACDAAGLRWRALSPADRTMLRYLAWRVSVEHEPAARPLAELQLPFAPRSFSAGPAALARVAAQLAPVEELVLPEDPVRAVALRRSVPDFLARRLADDFGIEDADALLAGLNEPPRYDLRANTLLTARDALQERLAAEGASTRRCAMAPDGLVAADRTGLFGRAHAEGLFELQDEGSQLLAALCGAAPGQTAIDWCAGGGGKTLALAAAVGRGGRVLACDANVRRLAGLAERARRARAERIVEVCGARPPDALMDSADVVLVDAPCSGIGGMRREADLRWRLSEAGLQKYPALQLSILREAAPFVRPGGSLVYGTCSPLRAEDEEVVARFLDAHSGFELLDARSRLALAADAGAGGFLRTHPQRHGTGAFFGAALRRRS